MKQTIFKGLLHPDMLVLLHCKWHSRWRLRRAWTFQFSTSTSSRWLTNFGDLQSDLLKIKAYTYIYICFSVFIPQVSGADDVKQDIRILYIISSQIILRESRVTSSNNAVRLGNAPLFVMLVQGWSNSESLKRHRDYFIFLLNYFLRSYLYP